MEYNGIGILREKGGRLEAEADYSRPAENKHLEQLHVSISLSKRHGPGLLAASKRPPRKSPRIPAETAPESNILCSNSLDTQSPSQYTHNAKKVSSDQIKYQIKGAADRLALPVLREASGEMTEAGNCWR
jgi:hypothetical protein